MQIHVHIPESVHACPRFCYRKPVLSTISSDLVRAMMAVKSWMQRACACLVPARRVLGQKAGGCLVTG